MITLTVNKHFNDETCKTEKKQVEPKNLYTRLYFCFKDFKENTKIKSVGFTIECGKYAMSGYFSRFIYSYPCSHPIIYDLNIYGQKFNCRTIREGIRHYTELFLKKINYEKE